MGFDFYYLLHHWGNLQLRFKLDCDSLARTFIRLALGFLSAIGLLGWGSIVVCAQIIADDSQGVWVYAQPPESSRQTPSIGIQTISEAYAQPIELTSRPTVERLKRSNGRIELAFENSNPKQVESISILKITAQVGYQSNKSPQVASNNNITRYSNQSSEPSLQLTKYQKVQPAEQSAVYINARKIVLPRDEVGIEIKPTPYTYMPHIKSTFTKPHTNNVNSVTNKVVKTNPVENEIIQPSVKDYQKEEIKNTSNFEHDWGISIEESVKINNSISKSNNLNKYNPLLLDSCNLNYTPYNINNIVNVITNSGNYSVLKVKPLTTDISNNSTTLLQNKEIVNSQKLFTINYSQYKFEGNNFQSENKQSKRSFSKDDQINDDRSTSQSLPPNVDLGIKNPNVDTNSKTQPGSTGTMAPPIGSIQATDKTTANPSDPNAKPTENKDSTGNSVDSEGFPIPPVEEGYIRFKAANNVKYDRKQEIITLEGDVTIYSGEIMIAADKLIVDQKSNTIQAWGYVCVQRYDDIFFSDEAYMNYNTGSFRAVGISGNSGGPQINGTLYFKGEELNGTFDKYTITRGEITTCEPYCAPEYSLYARKLVIEPKRKVTLIHGFTKIYKAKTFYIPYLVMPLEEQYIRRNQVRSDIQQTYGYNESEGYFGKFAYTYSQRYVPEVSSGLIGAALLDITTRRGFRYGLRQDYYFNKLGVGTIRGEYQSGPALDQKYKDRAEAKNFKIDFAQELLLDSHNQGSLSYKKIDDQPDPKRPRTNSENFNFQFSNTYKNFSLSSNFATNSHTSGGGTSTSSSKTESLTSGMNLRYQFNPLLDMTASQTYASNKNSSYTTADLEGASSLQFKWSPRPASVDVSFTRDQDFDGSKYLGDSTMSLNRVNPKINVTWKPSAIFGRYKSDIPITRLDTSFVDQITGNRNDPRKLQIWELNSAMSRNYKISKDSSVNFDLGFQQNFYSDLNARFSTSPRASFNFDDRHLFSCNFNWYKTRSFGRISPKASASNYNTHSNSISYSANLSDYEVWKLSVSSGYNMITRRQDPFSLGLMLDISPWIGMNIRGSYDYELQRAGPIEWTTQYYDPNGYFTAELRQSLRPYQGRGLHQSFYDRADLRISGRLHHDLDFNFYTEYQSGRSNAPIRELSFRKRNCCSQLDFGWRSTTDSTGELFVFFTLHAFPTRTAGARIIESDPYFFSPLSELVNPNVYTQGTGITF